MNPAALITNELDPALNAHDRARALELFSDDAVVRFDPVPPGLTGAFEGRGEIEEFLELIVPGLSIKGDRVDVEGPTVNWHTQMEADAFRSAGVNHVNSTWEALVKDEKVCELRIRFDANTLAELKRVAEDAGGRVTFTEYLRGDSGFGPGGPTNHRSARSMGREANG